ncbi:MAG TPA: condensation domain-containing protein, partial [Candidatus Anammoximicrobium sp.]|nr:condensation domain-containing protein [Candidatus Anammoximicrobium sp.]
QRALWFLHQWDPDSAAYNLPFAVRVRTAIDLAALQRALQIVTDRHSALRTTFPERGGQPIQVIQSARPVAVTTIDARQWSEARLYQEVSTAAYRPFDLARGPLFRGTIFTRAEQDHVLLFVAHHIIADFWSLVVLMSEIRQVYRPGGIGDESPLPPLPVQYADYVRWQEELLASAKGQQQWDYWSQQLGGELPLLNLPTDRPYPEIQTDRGGAVNFEIDDALAQGVNDLARLHGTTLFVVLLAAYQVLLYRYTRQSDILVGSPVATRGKAGFEQLVGYLTNMVVFRSDLGGNPTFAQLLRQVRKTVLGGLQHQDYPFSLLVERLQPIRDPSRPPIYQAAFLMEKSHRAQERGAAAVMMGRPDARLELGGFTMEPFGLRAAATPFELSLIIEHAGPHLAGCLQYNADLFEPATIERLGASYRRLLAAAVADPRQPIGQIPILPEAERIRLLVDWNATEAAYPQDLCCHELLEAQARQTPNATAVVFADQQLTYGELHQRSNQLAHYLRHLGVGPDTPVGICTERSLDMVVGLLGILKAGGAYLPLDPAFPQERLAFMLEDSGADLLLTQQQLAGDLPPYPGRIVCLDRDWDQIARHPADVPSPAAKPERLAYVIYTSGSTGRPKGVQIPHRALVNFLCSVAREPGLDRSDVLLSVTTLSFDIFALELYLPLLVGARVVLADRATAADPVRLQELLVQSCATVMQATPATWHMLLQANWRGDPGLRILVGGEALAPELANQLLARGRCLWNLYGPTETTVWSTLCQIQPE